MLLLMLVVPAALLVMLCALERYERLIDQPAPDPDSALMTEARDERSTDLADLGPELAPEAA